MITARQVYRFITLLLPLGLTPALGYLIAEDFIALGGGDKDLVWLLPWTLWALFFLVAGSVCWKRHASYLSWLGRSAGYSLGTMILLWGGLLGYSLLTT